MSEILRVLDPQAVEAAEYLRKVNRVSFAAEVAAVALGIFNGRLLTDNEVSQITDNPEQRAILACLARIHVDSSKTIANQSNNIPIATEKLLDASQTVAIVYSNGTFMNSLKGVEVDHRGRRHSFLAEMPRDVAKTCFASSVLSLDKTATKLEKYGEEILNEAYITLPDDHPTKSLIGIELYLARVSHGVNPGILPVINDFENLIKTDEYSNPHRVATVASWLIVWGDKNDQVELEVVGWNVFATY